MSNIYGFSKDPVLIKKLKLRIWRLRDEIESVLKVKLKNDPEFPESNLIQEMVQEYVDGGSPHVTEVRQKKNNGNKQKEKSNEEDLEDVETKDEGAEGAEGAEGEEGEEGAEGGEGDSEEKEKKNGDEKVITQRNPNIPIDKIINGTAILNEINMNEIYLFCDKKFLIGNTMVVEFLLPQKFSLNAEVVYCREFSMKSRVISDQKKPFRALLNFSFKREGERTLLRNFLKSIEPSKPEIKKDKAKDTEEEEESSDELDDLGL